MGDKLLAEGVDDDEVDVDTMRRQLHRIDQEEKKEKTSKD